jgi:hypothetical protein
MTQNVSDVNHSPFVFDSRDQPALVVTYIEHHKATDHVRVPPTFPNVSKILPIGAFGDLVPCV